ncbi:lysosomal Pro-X carboxypeptidase-like [Cucurbita pepo subsp. pepo]|uniref:lysosomal Pro-X carboxypeptidase-like n=1 Tax=Cucurbita pepo subsp. pepo TaxID=3664 RepID=UPI000C9D7DB9|nr:lysosomal Pro-X carboxypeptidase-like [Cucurbita pepo subsp. pepo]
MFLSPWIPFLLFVLSTSVVTALPYRFPRLSPIGEKFLHHSRVLLEAPPSDDFKTFYYNQTLDHFNYRPESYTTFPQRYIVNFKYWGGANSSAPIFAYLGAEAPIDDDLNVIGFMTDNAIQFNALLVYIEHRYYGKSVPFGSRDEALRNASTLGYFNSAQAIADYANILMHVKKELRANYSPVIVIGGSYGGMLASWFRLKYPHVALGALASSAPILYFDDITPQNGYYSVVTKDFREVSETCYETIKKSWSEMEAVALQPNGLSFLDQQFKTCRRIARYLELRDYLWSMYASAAQYNHPPGYPVTRICDAIDGAVNGTLGKIAAGVFAYRGNLSCYINEPRNETETDVGWRWQSCSEMVMPISSDDDMFPPFPFDLGNFSRYCNGLYGVPPRPHWGTTYYGGHDIQLVLQRFGSNIIFSNGLKDPYSIGGVLHNISDTLLAVHTTNGSHCLDILKANESDPEWVVAQRKTEVDIIKSWISKYYADLANYKQNKTF